MKRLVVANWKMNPQKVEDARMLASRIEHGLLGIGRENVEVAICPPFPFLPVLRYAVHFARLGVQNISAEIGGAFTGQVSVKQVKEFAAAYAIVGHSEVRATGEDDLLINRKMKLALSSRLHPILCVGFGTKKASSQTSIRQVVSKQISAALENVNYKPQNLSVAYEPVWAISKGLGTGQAVTPKHASAIVGYIKSRYKNIRVIYGGSIDSKNSEGFAREEVIDGVLVGGASLNVADFLKIIEAFSKIAFNN